MVCVGCLIVVLSCFVLFGRCGLEGHLQAALSQEGVGQEVVSKEGLCKERPCQGALHDEGWSA